MPSVRVTVHKIHENGVEEVAEFENDDLLVIHYPFAGRILILGGGTFVRGVQECLKLAQQFFKIWPGGK